MVRLRRALRFAVAITAITTVWLLSPAAGQVVDKLPVAPADPSQIGQQPIVEPEMADVFFGLRRGRLVDLERHDPIIRNRTIGLMVMKTRSTFEVPGAKSPIRLSSEDRLEFVIRSAAAGTEMDFSSLFSLRRLETRKNVRELLFGTGHVTPAGGTAQADPNYGSVAVKFSRYGEHSLKMTVTEPLPRGEYACVRGAGHVMFCFGVD